jgi:hypothetical protein
MDLIDQEILQCCLRLDDLFPVGVELDPSSVSQWNELKRSDSGYRKLCETEKKLFKKMRGLMNIEGFVRFEFRNAVINHIASFIFMSKETGDSKTRIQLGFMNCKIEPGGSIAAVSFETPFMDTIHKDEVTNTLETMAEMCEQKTPCSWFREFVYGMFPRLKRVPTTVLDFKKHCPSLNTDALTRLYVNEDGFQKTSDSGMTYVKGNVAVAWFFDEQNVTMIPTDRNRVQKGISQLGTYVYLVKYDKYDKEHRLHEIIVGWMGFAHSFGIVYGSVQWDEDYEEAARKWESAKEAARKQGVATDESEEESASVKFRRQRRVVGIRDWVTRDTHVESIRDSFDAVKKVFREDTSPLMLSQIFWGLMYVDSKKGYVNGVKLKGITASGFIEALAGDLLLSLETLTIIASRSFVTQISRQTRSTSAKCYWFQSGSRKFEWRWDQAARNIISFGFVD